MQTKSLLQRSHLRPLLIILLIAAVLELTLFNARHYELRRGCQSSELNLSTADIQQIMEGKLSILRFSLDQSSGLPQQICNITLELQQMPQDAVVNGSVSIDILKDVHGQSQQFTLVPGLPASWNFAVHPLQPVEGLSFELRGAELQDITISFNQPAALDFKSSRFVAVTLLLLFLYCVRPGSALYSYNLDLSHNLQKLSLLFLLLIQFGLMIFTTISTYPDFGEAVEAGNVVSGWNYNKRHYDLLTDALSKGSVSLVEKIPPEGMQNLDNPYDYWDREENGFPAYSSYIFDSAYYQGRYYIYYGVMPVLTLLLPYRLLTGKFLFLEFAMLFYASCALIALLYIYTNFVRHLFPKISWLVYWLGAAILLNSSGVIWCLRRAQSYEFAFTSAFFFITCGFAFNLSAVRGEKLSRWRLFAGCLLMACAVGCRPTTVLISLLNVPLFLPYFFGKKGHTQLRHRLCDICCAALPYLAVAAVLMLYNFKRFGSVLEFGQYYQLSTIDNLAYKNNSNLSEYVLGIINLIFGAPGIVESSFPFLKAPSALTFGYDGAIVLVRAFSVARICPLLYLLWLVPFFWKRLQTKERQYLTLCALFVALSFVMAATTAGIVGCHQRYILDFAWMIVLAALMSAMLISEWFYERKSESAFHFALAICLLISFAHFLVLSNGEENWFSMVNPVYYERIARLFCFWL